MPVVAGCERMVVPGHFPGSEAEGEEIVGLDLGHGVYLSPYTRKGVEGHAGAIVWHVHEGGTLCGGGISFVDDGGSPTWRVNSWDPLDIEPSVLASDCGLHGFIRQGRWEPA